MASSHVARVQVCDIVAAGALVHTSPELLPLELLLSTTSPSLLARANDEPRETVGTPSPSRSIAQQIWCDADRTAAGRFFVEVLQLPQRIAPAVLEAPALHFGTLQELTLHRAVCDPHVVTCLFSALPYARSVQTLCLDEPEPRVPWRLPKLECAWLVYAALHWRAATSSWQRLVLRNCNPMCLAEVLQLPHERRLEVLSATKLARLQRNKKRKRSLRDDAVAAAAVNGAPVYALQTLQVADSIPHGLSTLQGGGRLEPRVARLRLGTDVRVKPNSASTLLVVLQAELELELCHLWAVHWVCVLVPGFGFGWVDRRDVLSVKRLSLRTGPRGSDTELHHQQKKQPVSSVLSPSLTSLVLRGACLSTARTQLLVRTLGTSLVTLDVKTERIYSGILNDIAQSCPRLQTLTIKSKMLKLKGSALRTFFADSAVRHLRSLTLSWGIANPRVLLDILATPSQYAVARTLEELHICYVRANEYVDHEASFVRTLQRNTVLERLYLSGSERFEDLRVLHNFAGETTAHDKTLRERLAFLSAVARSALSVDVIKVIFAFALVQRVVGSWPPPALQCGTSD